MKKLFTATLISLTLFGNAQVEKSDSTKSIILREVTIQEKKVEQLEVTKMKVKALDLPVTTNTVGLKLIEQRNVSDLGDAVKSATGVRPINRYGGFQTFRIRGFNNFVLLVDGVRDERHNISTSAPSTNLANVERIEVLKGPAGVMYGHSALGGVLNIVRKKPSDRFTADYRMTYGSYNTFNVFGGLGGPITKKLKYRLDFGVTRTDGWRDFGVATNNFSFMLDYMPTKKDKLQLYVQMNNDLYDTDTGILMDEDGSLLEGSDPETRYNDPQDYLKHTRADLQLKYTHEFNSKLSVTNLLSWSFDDINYLSTEWLYFNATKDSLTRGYPFYFNHLTKPLQNQLDFKYQFNTGKIKHKAVVGHSFSYLDRKTFRGDVVGEGTFTTIAVQNPILNQGFIKAVDKRVQVKEELVNGFYLQDWVKFSDKLKALVGVRYDILSGTYYTDEVDELRNVTAPGEKTNVPSTTLTYRGGIVYQPIKTTSLFGSYSNYFKPSRRITADGQMFDPETGYQVEGGVKFEKGNKFSATLSTFYLLKNNIVERTAVNDFRQIGSADSKGIELDFSLEPLEGLYIKGGYSYTDARIRGYDVDSLQVVAVGNKLRFAPTHSANLWVSYEIQKNTFDGLGVGIGMNYVGENYTNSENTFELPAYTTLDGTIYYQAKRVKIGVNVNNITNQLYYTDAIYSNQFYPGQGRNFKISLGFKL